MHVRLDAALSSLVTTPRHKHLLLIAVDDYALFITGYHSDRCLPLLGFAYCFMNAADIFIGGVGQSATGNEIYGSPQIAVFMQGNDHTLSKADIHDAARQCSDCGSFYMGRDWT